jgi:alkylated DNA nucleotide flippase Atl1
LLVVTGVPLFVTPIPVGAVMVGAGLALLLRASPHARLVRRALARRFPGTAARMDRLVRRRR